MSPQPSPVVKNHHHNYHQYPKLNLGLWWCCDTTQCDSLCFKIGMIIRSTLLRVFILSWYWSAQLSYSAWACLIHGACCRYSEKIQSKLIQDKFFFRKNGYYIPAKPEQPKSCIILPVWYWPTWQRSTITWDEILNSTIFFSFSSLPEQPIKISFHHLCCSGIESVEVSSVLRLQAFRCETVDAPEKHQTIVNFTSTWELLL